MAIHIVQLGRARAAGEGPRIGTVRRPPRGVPKAEYASRDYYDVWLPLLAPSQELMSTGKAATTPEHWAAFVLAYRREMAATEASRVLDLLAVLSHTSDFAVGCYCDTEAHCHRSVLRQLLLERGATVAA